MTAADSAKSAAASLRLIRLELDRIATVSMPPEEQRGRRLAILQELSMAEHSLNRTLEAVVADARDDGASWGKVGHALGVTRQAACKRFGERRPPAPAQPGPNLLDQLGEGVNRG